MCTPTAAVAGGVAIGGAALGGFGAYTSALTNNNMAQFQSSMAKNNAAQAEIEADFIRERALERASQQRKDVAKFVGEQRAFMGASGVAVDQGTFKDITEDTIRQGKLDELAILYEGDVGAWQAEMQAQNYLAQSELFEMGMVDPLLSAVPGVMSGFGSGLSTLMRSRS